MKILQVGNICGIPQALAKEQRRRGHEADGISFTADYSIPGRIRKFVALCKWIPAYDAVHFHYSTGLPFGLDLLIWKAMGKTVIMHYHGSDIRGRKVPILTRLLASKIYVSTPDLLEWAKGATWQPQAIDISSLPYQPCLERH
jgi:glycosyltransferase involved in cell wall biosynthesis